MTIIPTIRSLSSLKRLTDKLCATDSTLAELVQRYGYPQLWGREKGINTIIRIILEQQVSLTSAQATYAKLEAHTNALHLPRVVAMEDSEYRLLGVSRQKAGYIRNLAQAVLNKSFLPHTLHALPDEEVRRSLCSLKGIGNWSADIYLLMALRRTDIFPTGDLAIQIALRELYAIEKEEFDAFSQRWQPLRSVATRILWRYYLRTR